MKGWIEVTTPKNGDILLKASAVSGIYEHLDIDSKIDPTRSNLVIDGTFITVIATREEICLAIEEALS